jgi:hypothetical protein
VLAVGNTARIGLLIADPAQQRASAFPPIRSLGLSAIGFWLAFVAFAAWARVITSCRSRGTARRSSRR